MNNQPSSSDPRVQDAQPLPVEPAPYSAASHSSREANVGGAYSQSREEQFVDSAGNQVVSHTEVVEDENQRRANSRYWVATITYFILGVLEVILALRFLFRLMGANPNSGFIAFLYNISYPFVAPFNGIFVNQAPAGNSVFEFSTIVAMLIYALIAWGIVSLGRLLFSPNYNGQQQVTMTRRRRNS